MHRMIETKKAEKIQANLHMIDIAKQNDRILFVSNYDQIKQHKAVEEESTAVVLPGTTNPKLE